MPEVVQYREALRTPWWWYPVAALIAGIISAQFHLADESLTDWVPYVILVPFALGIVWRTGRSQLTIQNGELRIRGAHISLDYVSGAVSLDPRTLRLVVGREGDPAAFISIRPWIGAGVQVWLDDPNDPVPYWVVSTRQPGRVVEIIRDAIVSG